MADVNLEQVGRTDDTEGPRIGAAVHDRARLLGRLRRLHRRGRGRGRQGVPASAVQRRLLRASDNQALADLGVPAHTICVAFMYPDYHGAADHWDKIDYANMAKVDRMVARGLLMIADNPVEPKWNESNPKAARYLKAWKAVHGR